MIEAAIEVNNQRNTKYQEMITKIKDNEPQFQPEPYPKNNSLKDFNAYENIPEVRMSVMMNHRQDAPLNQFNEESQVLSLGGYKNVEHLNTKQGYYQHFKGAEYADPNLVRNIHPGLKPEEQLYIDGKQDDNCLGQTEFRNQVEANIMGVPTKNKIKSNKYRKKSKLKDSKFHRTKDGTISYSMNKSKTYKMAQGRMESNESVGKSSGKASSNSFIFMKNAKKEGNKAATEDQTNVTTLGM